MGSFSWRNAAYDATMKMSDSEQERKVSLTIERKVSIKSYQEIQEFKENQLSIQSWKLNTRQKYEKRLKHDNRRFILSTGTPNLFFEAIIFQSLIGKLLNF